MKFQVVLLSLFLVVNLVQACEGNGEVHDRGLFQLFNTSVNDIQSSSKTVSSLQLLQ